MNILYHNDGTLSKIKIPELKQLNINFIDWYCPIHSFIWLVRHDGTIKSGTCGQNIIHDQRNPFWNEQPYISATNTFCATNRGACSCGADLNSPKAISKDFYNEFIEKVFNFDGDILKTIQPYSGKEIVAIGQIDKILHNIAEIHLDIGKKCNFDCSYCPSGVHDNFSPFMSLKTIQKALDIIESHSGVISNKNCVITGGEPTLFKDLTKLIEMLKLNNFKKIKINTNGTASYNAYANLLEDKNIKLDLSFHYEFTTEKIIKKCSKLKQQFHNQVELKALSRTQEFINQVNSYTKDFQQFPIYEKHDGVHNIVKIQKQ